MADRSQIEHPAHYNRGKIEVIDFIEDQQLGFVLGNAVKYICRAGFKGDKVQDLEKACFYLQWEISRLVSESTKEQEEAVSALKALGPEGKGAT